MTTVPKPWAVRLEPFGMMFAGICECLDEKSLEELVQLREDCERATTTNCWCYAYQAAQFLKRHLDGRIALKREMETKRKAGD